MKKKKVIDMGKNTQFIPEIWSEYILDKFRELSTPFKDELSTPFKDFNGRSQYMRNLSEQVKEMADKGMTPDEIAEKIDPESDTVKTDNIVHKTRRSWDTGTILARTS